MLRRRSFLLGTAALGPLLAGCAASVPSAAPPSVVAPAGPAPVPAVAALEAQTGLRIGVQIVDTATGATAAHRADERFLTCSTIKAALAAFVLHRSVDDPALLDRLVRYTRADLLAYAPVTTRNLASGMTVAQLCEAAVTVSDNTAANLLGAQVGGPAALTAWLRTLGDTVTRADRTEPALNAVQGDLDTSTPAAFTATLGTLVLGDALPAGPRDRLTGWLRANTTGDDLIRAGVPAGWQVADKTGSGDRGERNDVAVLYPPQGPPLLLSVFTSPATDSRPDGAAESARAVAAATRAALATLGRAA